MGSSFVVFGDSYTDTGNLDALVFQLTRGGVDLYEPFPYNSLELFDNSTRLSDGEVLSDSIATLLGISFATFPQTTNPYPSELINFALTGDASGPGTGTTDISLNYSFAGATSSFTGKEDPLNPAEDLSDLPIGVLTQIGSFVDAVRDGDLSYSGNGPDILISTGGNDFSGFIPEILSVLSTDQRQDDTLLGQQIADSITGNIETAVSWLQPFADTISILGPFPLGRTPFAYQIEKFGLPGGALPLPPVEGLGDFLTGVTERINDQLAARFDPDQGSGFEDVLVIDGSRVFNRARRSWRKEYGSQPDLTQALNRFYPGNGKSVESFFYVDGFHFTDAAYGYLAEATVELMGRSFPDLQVAL